MSLSPVPDQAAFLQYFKTKGVEIKMVALPTREANKDFDLVYKIARELEAFGLNRCPPPPPLPCMPPDSFPCLAHICITVLPLVLQSSNSQITLNLAA